MIMPVLGLWVLIKRKTLTFPSLWNAINWQTTTSINESDGVTRALYNVSCKFGLRLTRVAPGL